jgi:tripartite-type tricarboxylate transporter receptor subunit TctC
VHGAVPARSLGEFVALARARPGAIDYASTGNGGPLHLAMAAFLHVAGVELNHIPYRGAPPAWQDLMAGRVSAMMMPLHTAQRLSRDGTLRILAVAGDTRAAAAPEIPAFAEAGFPAIEVDLWYGMVGPANLPAPLAEAMNAAVNAWLAEPATQATLSQHGLLPGGGGTAAFAALMRRDRDRWAEMIRTLRITAD